MQRFKIHAFTLIELLVVITIIGILAGLALPVFSAMQLAAKRTQSLSSMRQLGTLTIGYCNDNNQLLPVPGVAQPDWGDNTAGAWYNVVPWQVTGSHSPGTGGQGLADYQNKTAQFYSAGSLFLVPAAKYPATKLQAPLFAVSYNSELVGTNNGGAATNLLLSAIQLPAQTCLYQESGLSGETAMQGQSASNYNGQASTYATRSIARYNGQTLIVFADGHAGQVLGSAVVDPNGGGAYNPQLGGAGKVVWTPNPASTPN